MNRIIIILSFFVLSCKPTAKELNYNGMLKKHISSDEIQSLFHAHGKDYDFVNAYGIHFYKYDDLGLELNFSSKDTLRKIYFKSDKIALPFSLKLVDTRAVVENKIGQADTYEVGAGNLIGYYFEKDLTVIYKTKDTIDLENKVKQYTLSKLNREKIVQK